MLEFKKETITPAKATKLLKDSADVGFVNRGKTNSFVKRYAGDMEKGHWQADTGETIKIAKNGAVIDGQHRLSGVIESGVSVKMWVCRNIDISMFQYIDQGKQRDLNDIMTIEGWDNPRDMAVVGKMLWRNDRDKNGNPFAHAGAFNESDGNIYDWVITVRPDLRVAWKSYGGLIRKCYNSMMKTCPASLLFYLLYQWLKEDSDAALLFFGYLSDTSSEPPHMAMQFFRDYCIEMKLMQKDGKLSIRGRHADLKEVQFSAAQYAWSLIASGKRSVTYSGFKRGLGQKNAKALEQELAA